MNKRTIAIALLLTTLLTGCPQEKPSNWFQQNGWILLETCGGTFSPTTVTHTDMMDGTVRMQESYVNQSPCWGRTTHISSTVYIKKCLQGQLYRAAQNDCQGVGMAPDWGAQRFQFCPTNDRACESYNGTNYSADPTKSPAAISCANDTTAGRSWRMIDRNSAYIHVLPADSRTQFPDLPSGNLSLIWLNHPYFILTNETFYMNPDGTVSSGVYQNKNSSQFVLCISVN